MIDPNDFTLTPAMRSVIQERMKQEAKWGQQNHEFPVWLTILTEELGETSQEYLKATFEGMAYRAPCIREELVQVVAVALAMLECCDRNDWHVPKESV